jgi:hypothetical protein
VFGLFFRLASIMVEMTTEFRCPSDRKMRVGGRWNGKEGGASLMYHWKYSPPKIPPLYCSSCAAGVTSTSPLYSSSILPKQAL